MCGIISSFWHFLIYLAFKSITRVVDMLSVFILCYLFRDEAPY